MRLLGTISVALALLAASCGGDDDIGDGALAFIDPANAGEAARVALPAVEDLPGEGWEVITRDDFGGGDDPNEFLRLIEDRQECQTLNNLATLQDIFGGSDAGEPAGRAQIEFEQASSDQLLPTSLEVEVEVADTVSEVQGSWALVRELFESDETAACFVAVFNGLFTEQLGESGIELDVESVEGSAVAPQDGATLAFQIDMSLAGIELDLMMQMYFWPYGNASAQAFFFGPTEVVDTELVGTVLEIIENKLSAAAMASQ